MNRDREIEYAARRLVELLNRPDGEVPQIDLQMAHRALQGAIDLPATDPAQEVFPELAEAMRQCVDGIAAANHALTTAMIEAMAPLKEAILVSDADSDFLDAVAEEVKRARAKFPGKNVTMLALMEEVGELAKASFSESRDNVRKEAVQVACMALRMATEGDHTLDQWRRNNKLDRLTPDSFAAVWDDTVGAIKSATDGESMDGRSPVPDPEALEWARAARREHVQSPEWWHLAVMPYVNKSTMDRFQKRRAIEIAENFTNRLERYDAVSFMEFWTARRWRDIEAHYPDFKTYALAQAEPAIMREQGKDFSL